MARPEIATIQIGKQGLTKGCLELLEKVFENHELVKIAILKSCTREREELKKIAENINSELERKIKKRFTFRIVGFTIFMRKWRRNVVKG